MAIKTKEGLQFFVKKHVAISLCFGISVTYIAWVYVPIVVPVNPGLLDRLTFTLRWLVLSIIPIFIGIQLVANTRFSNIDKAGAVTTTPYAEELIRLKQRALQNTLEQTALHVPLMLILSTYLDSHYLKLVPILICLFVFARITFYIGYLATGDQLNRAFGFALTILSNIIPFGYCLYCLVMGGANYELPIRTA